MPIQQAIQIWGAGTTRTFRPVWTAEELNLEYELIAIGPRTGETQTPEFTRLNPKQKIPALVDGDMKLSESVAMSRYLIERYGDASTLSIPADIETRAREDEWVCYCYGELDETSLYVMRRHGDLKEIYGEAPNSLLAAREYANKHLKVVSDHLEDKKYVVGSRFGLADIILISCLDWAINYGFDLSEPLTRYRERIIQREAYKSAYRSNYAQQL